ncbi:Small auxin-up RNA [Dillenia turbinata]|uniref:Small auxin-up RNA n=1 Tax=Dillenia turbinata TaxID=194707 RepID=A0AAN8W7K0_9MAGN
MIKIKGFKVKKIFKWVVQKINQNRTRISKALVTNICGFRRLSFRIQKRGYARVGQELEIEKKQMEVPKGYLAVYVGESDDVMRRMVVPVIYFNHPLFADLLREAEEEFGFDHPGAITLPCRVSDFENVQLKISATAGYHRRKCSGKYTCCLPPTMIAGAQSHRWIELLTLLAKKGVMVHPWSLNFNARGMESLRIVFVSSYGIKETLNTGDQSAPKFTSCVVSEHRRKS